MPASARGRLQSPPREGAAAAAPSPLKLPRPESIVTGPARPSVVRVRRGAAAEAPLAPSPPRAPPLPVTPLRRAGRGAQWGAPAGPLGVAPRVAPQLQPGVPAGLAGLLSVASLR